MHFIEDQTENKLRGGYYTPLDIAAFLSRWVTQSQRKEIRVLEPSCGDGVFIRAISNVKKGGNVHVTACELIPSEASKTRRISKKLSIDTKIVVGDFLQWSLTQKQGEGYDGVVGNPPFIRYQYLNSVFQKRAEDVFEKSNLYFTKHSNAWAPFVISAINLLKPGGRFAMVLPAEILHVLHAQSIREFLIGSCSKILIVDPQELWFTETLQGVVLLLAEKKVSVSTKTKIAIQPFRTREFLKENPEVLFNNADYIPAELLNGKWTPGLLTKKERGLFFSIREQQLIPTFSDIASVDVGIVTGANDFFLVSKQTIEENDLEEYASPMFGRSGHVQGVIFDNKNLKYNQESGLPSFFIQFGSTAIKKLPKKAQQYILNGESQGLHKRYKCSIRRPWYNVPSVWASRVSLLKRSHEFPRLTFNKIKVYTTDTAYRIYAHSPKVKPEHLVFSFVNSLTALTGELEGRHYGGGVLELVPSEIEKLLVPISVKPSKNDLLSLHEMFKEAKKPEEILLSQDRKILNHAGLSSSDQVTIHNAWSKLRMRRQRDEKVFA